MTTQQSPIQLIVFDWDGTLFQSTLPISQCLVAACIDVDLPPPTLADAQYVIGLSLSDAVRTLYPDRIFSTEQTSAFANAYRERYWQLQSELGLFVGMGAMLEGLAQRGVTLAVATGKGRRGLDAALQRCQVVSLFSITRCAEETRAKPHPQMLLEIMKHTMIPNENALMVGDTTFDIDMGHAAGLRTLAVTYGAHDATLLQKSKPLHTANDPAQLAQILDNLTRG